MSGDRIHLKGLKVEARIGVHDWEQRVPRTLVVDLDIAADVARAARTDALADTADYAAIAATVGEWAAASRCQLIETFAEKLAQELLRRHALAGLRLTVHKPGAVPGAQDVSVTVERKAP